MLENMGFYSFLPFIGALLIQGKCVLPVLSHGQTKNLASSFVVKKKSFFIPKNQQ